MATVCPHAQYDPLGPQTADRMSAHDIVCLHTMAGSFAGTDSMFHRDGFGGTESHFGVAGSGRAKQWQDLDFRADANYEGNGRIISIETADVGESFPDWLPDGPVPPWTPAQLDRIVKIVGWCCDRYAIPKRLVPDSRPGRRGIAYHRQGIDGNFTGPYRGRQGVGELWSKSGGKVCPGDARITQLIEIVIPRVRGEEDDMTIPELIQALEGKGPGAKLRKVFKGLIQGSGLDALREPEEGDSEKGAWRGQIEQIVDERLAARDPQG